MNKREFSAQICSRLKGLPQDDIKRSIDYYTEMIDDRMEDGLSEDEAVAALGSVDDIVSQIQSELSVSENTKTGGRSRSFLKAWQVILIILGIPIWLPLLAAAAVIILSLYIVLWSVIISLYAVDLSLTAAAIGSISGAAMLFYSGHPIQAVLFIGAAFICGGLAILFFFVCNLAGKGAVILSRAIAHGIKSIFTRKERVS